MPEFIGDGFSLGLLGAALFFGLRHGIDWDHIAAITDIAATQESPRRGFRLGTAYVLGHAIVVFVLGVIIITIGKSVPDWLDAAMGKVVGWSLIILAIAVVASLIRNRNEFRMRSRWMMLFAAVRTVGRFVEERILGRAPQEVVHDHPHVAGSRVHHDEPDTTEPEQAESRLAAPTHRHPHTHHLPEADYSLASVAVIGALHGIGAETPTQIVLFLAAAHAGGLATGIAVLVAFIVGLVISNSAITLLSTVGFRATANSRRLHVVLGAVTAAVSLVVGTLLVMGAEASLPALIAG